MESFDAAIIGFGAAGRALGAALADAGQKVAVVEQSDQMYGGACVNNACLPTKALVQSARLSAAMGGPLIRREERFTAAMDNMDSLRKAKRQANYQSLASRENITIIAGQAFFSGPLQLTITHEDSVTEAQSVQVKRIFVDTGSLPILPDIPGIDSPRVYVSSSLIEVRTMPQHLVVIGAGYVGLEFASMYADFGSQVTLLQRGPTILEHEDAQTAEAVKQSLVARGVEVHCNAQVNQLVDDTNLVFVEATVEGNSMRLPADAVLIATGRKPNTQGLHVEAAGIECDQNGALITDDHLRTTAEQVWALGDCAGSPQFTYVAYDDFRIVCDDVLGSGKRTVNNRGYIPRCTFVHPPFARIGMTAEEAREAGFSTQIYSLDATNIGQAAILQDTTGLMKAVVDQQSGLVLGMDLFCEEAQELVNLAKIVMDARIPASVLRNAIFTHPSMTEAFNNLFA